MPDEPPPDSTQVQVGRPTVTAATLHGLPIIPGYDVLREIGRGGMGVVYEARQVKLDRLVALKLMLGDDPLNKARFLAEGQVIAAVKHPHVVEVYDFGESPDGPYIAMEYLTGGPLSDRLKAGPPFSPKEAAGLVARVASGVGAAHGLGVVHRDLKPGNVLLDADGSPKVTDFGLAKRTTSDLTQTQDAAGTPAYMAPEQARAMKFVGPPADVWSLGVMLYESLTGRRPFAAETDVELLVSIQEADPPTLRTVSKAVPHDLETVCLRCLEKEPDRRYPTAKELAADLAAWADGKPIAARRATPAERAVLWVRRKPTLAAAWAFGTLALALGTFAVVATSLWTQAASERAAAVDAQGRAEQAEQDANQARDLVQRVEYARAVYSAHQDALHHNFARANQLLAGTRKELRGWEWDYVHRLCHSDLYTIPNRHLVRLSPDGSRFLAVGRIAEAEVFDTAAGTTCFAVQPSLDAKARERGIVSAIGIVSATFNATGELFAFRGTRQDISVWDARTGTERHAFLMPNRCEEILQLSSDGSRVATRHENAIFVWDAAGQKLGSAGRQSERVVFAAVDAECQRIVVKDADARALRVLDAATGDPLVRLAGAESAFDFVTFSPGGGRIAALRHDGLVTVWDARTGAALRTIPTGPRAVPLNKIRFTVTDGRPLVLHDASRRMVSRTPDGVAHVWDVESGRAVATLVGHRDVITSVTFNRDGRRIVTASDDGTAILWDTESGKLLVSYAGHAGPIQSAEITTDGAHVVTAGDDGVRVWDANRGSRDFAHKLPVGSDAIAFRADGERFVTPANGFTVYDANTGRRIVSKAHTDPDPNFDKTDGDKAAFSPDGTRVATNSMSGEVTLTVGGVQKVYRGDGAARVYDAATGKELVALAGHTERVNTVAFSPDGRRVVTTSDDKTARVWDAATGKELLKLTRTKPFGRANGGAPVTEAEFMRDAAFSPDGATVLTLAANALTLWAADTGREGPAFDCRPRSADRSGGFTHPGRFCFHPDGNRVALIREEELEIWDVRTGREVVALPRHARRIRSARFNRDGRRLVTTSWDGAVRVWDAESGAEALALSDADVRDSDAAFSPDGTRLFGVGPLGVTVWDSRPVSREFLPKATDVKPTK
ncbi:WD40 repeat domain-containing serine/threonine-protein kinase [Limnoglobus roseus]|uniref:non-specific serine/threonine protein kinase n=1 Tax=Limnoglobus roseus TaxID=2598579 RepID=A0A5C1AR54_9BACT|nr:protein kinase [Limnoglobus roseus]QEL20456.1 serine/threonine protein kinase [Limnoglobus roseus]